MTQAFHSIHTHGFVRAAVCTPAVIPGDPGFNAAETLRLAREGDARGCDLMLFPELGISAYAIDDLRRLLLVVQRLDRCRMVNGPTHRAASESDGRLAGKTSGRARRDGQIQCLARAPEGSQVYRANAAAVRRSISLVGRRESGCRGVSTALPNHSPPPSRLAR